jgi:predicted DsbA family dithiol-disulfide isomerase
VAQALMQIDVISDVICPWCFLGKRRLDKAVSMVPEAKIEVVFRPFFLDPNIPAEGLDRHAYMAAKFGEERLKTIHKPLEEMGAADAVPFQFDKITRTPNTLDAHRLIRWAMRAGKQPAVVEALFVAYWRDGLDVGDAQVLADVATACGMDGREIKILLAQDTDKTAVLTEAKKALEMGVQGVPTMIFNHKYGLSGAQDAATVAAAIRNYAGAV